MYNLQKNFITPTPTTSDKTIWPNILLKNASSDYTFNISHGISILGKGKQWEGSKALRSGPILNTCKERSMHGL